MLAQEFPFVIGLQKNNWRMLAQGGCFMLFPSEHKDRDWVQNFDDCFEEVLVPRECAQQILTELFRMGIRFSNVYPELSFVAKDIIMKQNIMNYVRNGE